MMDERGLRELLPVMIAAVEHAAVATRFVQRACRSPALAKDDRSPVTAADWASQAVISILLRDAAPTSGIPLVGEEDAALLRDAAGSALRLSVSDAVSRAIGRTDESACADAIDRGRAEPVGRFLTLDPVDGTKGFLRGEQYAISLALIEDGEVLAGVVGCPNLPPAGGAYDAADPEGCVAFAARRLGAFIRHRGTDRRAVLATWSSGDPVRACESVESSHSRQDLAADLLRRLGTPGLPARLDSQAKYAVVARGDADVYLRLPTRADYREKIWDHAAGALVATEAGALVCDVDGRPLDFGCGRELTRNRGVLAGNPAIVGRLVELHAEVAGRG